MGIGENIRKLRIARGLTQESIHKQSGLTTSYQSQIENGSANAGKKTISKYCEVFCVDEMVIRFGERLNQETSAASPLPHGTVHEEQSYAIRRVAEIMRPLSEEKRLILLAKVLQSKEEGLLS